METQKHLPILKRVGGVLLLVGLIDIAVMLYCIVNDMAYSSSFNVFAVIAGISLLRGNLRAASIVRAFAVFMLAALVTLLIAWPFMQPFDLTLTRIRVDPSAFAAIVVFIAFVFGLLLWVTKELGREPIQDARFRTGSKRRDIRIPALVGIGLVVAMNFFSVLFLGGESAERAKSIAEQQVGLGYRFHVDSLDMTQTTQGTIFSGVVTAWNEKEVKDIQVRWEGP